MTELNTEDTEVSPEGCTENQLPSAEASKPTKAEIQSAHEILKRAGLINQPMID